MSRSEIEEHLGYWLDPVKRRAYAQALDEVIRPGMTVLDLGAGTAMLGMLAAQAGADRVIALDSGDIIGPARELVRANGFEDRFEFIRGLSTDVELPPVDVIVCDQIGGLAHDAGVLRYFADAAPRSLRPGGQLMPVSFELFLAPVEAAADHKRVSGWEEESEFDLSVFADLAANTDYRIEPDDLRLVAEPARFAEVASDDDRAIIADLEFTISEGGVMHGLVGWFAARLSATVTVTNSPLAEQPMRRWLSFHPLAAAHDVSAGDHLAVRIDLRPAAQLVSWTVDLNGRRIARLSTFHGRFLDGGLRRPQAPGAGDRAELASAILLALAGGASVEDQIAKLDGGSEFPTRAAAARFVERLATALS